MKLQPPALFWELPSPGETPRPGVSMAELDVWEARHQLPFPLILRKHYLQQNGGRLASGPINLRPLEELTRPPLDLWEHFTEQLYSPDTLAACVLVLACQNDAYYLLDYSRNQAPEVRALVVTATQQVSYFLEGHWTLEEFLAAPHTLTSEPPFTWDEVATLERVFLHERDEVSPCGWCEEIIGQRANRWVHYRRGKNTLIRTEITILPDPYQVRIGRYEFDSSYWRFAVGTHEDSNGYQVIVRRHPNSQWETACRLLPYIWIVVRDKQRLSALLDGLYGPALMRRVRRWQRLVDAFWFLWMAFLIVFVVPFVLLAIGIGFVWRAATYPFRALWAFWRPPPAVTFDV